MHELPVMQKVVEVVLRHAGKHRVERVAAVHLQVGELSDLQEEWMQRYFDRLSSGTVAEGARLKVERTQARLGCRSCGREYPWSAGAASQACPACGAEGGELVSGREYTITSLEAI